MTAIGVDAVSVVKAPVDGLVLPMAAPSMVPEVMAATELLPPPPPLAPLNPEGEKLNGTPRSVNVRVLVLG